MVKHTQTIRRQFANESLSVFDHFMKLALKRLSEMTVFYAVNVVLHKASRRCFPYFAIIENETYLRPL